MDRKGTNFIVDKNATPTVKDMDYKCHNCSKANCENRNKIRTEIRKCAYCGRDFEWKSIHPNQKYCSKECREWATKTRTKGFGGDPFLEALHSEVLLKVTDLINKSMENSTDFSEKHISYWRFGEIPKDVQEKVLKRDNYECQVCKRRKNIQIHHIIKQKNGGSNDMNNLVTLCSSCHRHIEIGDIPHAVELCFENVRKQYLVEDTKKANTKTTVLELKNDLVNIFKKIEIENTGDYNHILTKIDNVIDKLQDMTI